MREDILGSKMDAGDAETQEVISVLMILNVEKKFIWFFQLKAL
jgi:hypothetical protein